MKELYKNIFAGDVILPKSPLKSINSYIIKGEEQSLVIDTGFDHPESEEAFFAQFDELSLQAGRVDLYLTHLHADHTGLCYKFQERFGGKIYCSKIDADYINSMANKDYFTTHQYRPEFLGLENDGHFFDHHPAVLYGPKHPVDIIPVKEGDVLSVGDYRLEVISVPGHTPDHTALYERTHKLLFSGDHILDKITPNISFWRFEYGDILGTYLNSLEKVYRMDVDIVFPSHRVVVHDHRKRIDELIAHHEDRLNDIRNILADGGKKTATEVASRMHWDFRAKDFESFPPNQKWFACGEAMAHLVHLEAKGEVRIIHTSDLEPVLFYREG